MRGSSSSLLDGLQRPFTLLLRLVLARPRSTLALCAALAVVGGGLAATRIGFNPDLNAVIGSEHRFNLVFEDYRESFGEHATFIVVIHDGHDPRTHTFARELAHAYNETGAFRAAVPVLPPPHAGSVTHEPLAKLEKGLARLAPLRDVLARPAAVQQRLATLEGKQSRTAAKKAEKAELQALLSVVPNGKQLVRPLTFSDIVDALTERLDDHAEGVPLDAETLASLAAYAELLEAGLRDSQAAPHPQRRGVSWNVPDFYGWALDEPTQPASESPSEPVALVVVTPYPESSHLAGERTAEHDRLTELEALALFKEVFERHRLVYPDLSAGLTGRPLLNAQERELQQRSSTLAGTLSFTIVLLLVFVFVRRVRMSLAIGVALAVALAWTMGGVALTIGELNVLSSAFAVVLAAIGVDFGIHLAAAFEHRQRLGEPRATAIEHGFAHIGRGVIAAALTTALGFLVTSVAEFRAIAELGQIAAAGMLLCLLSMYTVLPAMLLLLEPPRRKEEVLSAREIEPPGRPYGPWPVALVMLLACGALVALSLVAGQRVGFNTNRLELLDPSLSSISWMRVMDRHSPQSSRFGVAIAEDRQEAAELAEAFRERPDLVREVLWLGELVPREGAARRELLERWAGPVPRLRRERETLFRPDAALAELRQPKPVAPGQLPSEPARQRGLHDEPVTRAELAQQRRRLGDLAERLADSLDGAHLLAALHRLERAMARQPSEARRTLAPLAELAERWRHRLHVGLPEREPEESRRWQRTANAAGPGWERLLRGELATLEALAGELPTTAEEVPPAVYESFRDEQGRYLVQAFAATDIWEEEAGRAFIAFGESVHPDFTGPAAQYFRAVDLMERGLLRAAKLALMAVFVLLLFDFLPARRALWPLGVLLLSLAGLVFLGGLTLSEAVLPAVALAALLALPWIYPVALAATPLGVGIALTLGAMSVAGQSFNPANIVVLPALLGIGIDIGLHLVHAARRGDGRVRLLHHAGLEGLKLRLRGELPPQERPPRMLTPTARAVLITSVTTVAGFGTLIVAGHAGIRSLGWLFAVAITLCTLAAFLLLPAITRLWPLPTNSEPPPENAKS